MLQKIFWKKHYFSIQISNILFKAHCVTEFSDLKSSANNMVLLQHNVKFEKRNFSYPNIDEPFVKNLMKKILW